MPSNDWTIVLDLDNTLLCSVEDSKYAKSRAKLDEFMKSEGGKHSAHHWMRGAFHIYARPGLQDFLDFAFRNFRVIIWTAASCDYMWFIVRHFILTGKNAEARRNKIAGLFSDRHCEMSQQFMKETDSPKHLPWMYRHFPELGIDPARTIFLDDHSQVQKHNPRQIIYTPAFEVLKGKPGDDRFMWDVQEAIKRRLQLK